MRRGVFVLMVGLLLIGFAGCGGGKQKDEGAQVSEPLKMAKVAVEKEKAPGASGEKNPAESVLWADIPAYPGAGIKRGYEGAQDEEGDAGRRILVSADTMDKIAAFYRDAMIAQGWEERMFVTQEDLCMATWQKQESKEKVSIKILTDSRGGSTIIVTRINSIH